jgi:hypothetical protein
MADVGIVVGDGPLCALSRLSLPYLSEYSERHHHIQEDEGGDERCQVTNSAKSGLIIAKRPDTLRS